MDIWNLAADNCLGGDPVAPDLSDPGDWNPDDLNYQRVTCCACSSSSAGPCCDLPENTDLNASIVGTGDDCDCLASSVVLHPDGINQWKGNVFLTPVCTPDQLIVWCDEGVWRALIECAAMNTGTAEASSVSCDPFQLTFALSMENIDPPNPPLCCVGTVNITVTL